MTVTDEARAWLAGWGELVAAAQMDAARPRFDHSVVGFGTKAQVARGLDALVAQQWSHVWPNIEGFAFDADGADVWVSDDGTQVVIAAGWTSLGRAADGSTFPRDGRATAVLKRDPESGTLSGVHTHFSLVPVDPGTHLGD